MSMRWPKLRHVLAAAALLVSAAVAEAKFWRLGEGVSISGTPAPLTGVTFGTLFQYNSATKYLAGDTYGNTWSDDGNNYTMVNDTPGVNGTNSSRNISFGKITGSMTGDSTTTWTLVNDMLAWGTETQNTGTPSASHKTGGLISIGGVLYTVGWRLDSTGALGFDGQLIKSTDHGASWTPPPPSGALPYVNPMFPGSTWPFGWVQYGQNYTGNGPDNSANYAYMTVRSHPSSGQTCCYLARVALSAIANQVATDWSYYQGTNGSLDGNQSASWGPLASAGYIFGPNDGTTGQGEAVQYLPRYQQYLYFTQVVDGTNSSHLAIRTAYHPWGPWTTIGNSPSYAPQKLGFAFTSPATVSGKSLTILLSSSNLASNCAAGGGGYYCLYLLPVTLSP
jgi:hypothetical protein